MSALAEAVPGARPAILGHDAIALRSAPRAIHGYAPDFVASYDAHFFRVNPYIDRWTGLGEGTFAASGTLASDRDLLRTEYWADWLRPQGDIRHGYSGVLRRDATRSFLFCAKVERRHADRVLLPLGTALTQCFPLMGQALDMNRQLFGLHLQSELLNHGLGQDVVALFVLAEGGRLLYANARGHALLAAGRIVRLDAFGQLALSHPPSHARLHAASSRPERAGLSLMGLGAGRVLRLLGLSPETMAASGLPLLSGTGAAGLLVAVCERGADARDPLIDRFGLTDAEADVVRRLAEGAGIDAIAEARHASAHTIRNQLKSARAKADAHSQADLVRLATRYPL